MTTARIVMSFHSKAAQDGAMLIAAAEGVETLGQPFRFDLDLVSDDPHLDLAALLRADARLTMNRTTVLADGRQVAYDYDYHGKLASIRQVGRAGARRFRYRAVLRPHLWQLSRSRRSRIYTDKTVPDLLRTVFDESGIAYQLKLASEKAYPIHPYLVQYEETDLDFVMRWMEHVGICHYYDAQGDRGTLVLTDHPGGYVPLGASQRVEFSDQPQQGWGSGEMPHIVRLEIEDTPVPLRVQLKEYNYEAPANEMLYEAEVDPKGVGIWYEYNSNFRSEIEGRFLAMVRRDYWRGRARRLYGETDHRGFQCGRTFTPVRHFNHHVSDRDFVLIEVCHKLDQGDGEEAAASGSYSCTFTAMPADLPYRPERETPWPSIHGVVHGRVAGGALDYAELDSMGRYKIDVDYDLNDQTIARVRMAQPSVGEAAGMHFPLRKDTEVLIGHIDGDPDKPVILGAVHDASKPNIVNKANDPLGTISSLRSQGGNVMEMQDDGPHKALVMANGNLNTVQMFGRPSYQHLVEGSSSENAAHRPPAPPPRASGRPAPMAAVAGAAPAAPPADPGSAQFSGSTEELPVNYAITPNLLVDPGETIKLHIFNAKAGYAYIWFARQMTTADEDTSIYITGAEEIGGPHNPKGITRDVLNHDDVQMTEAEKDALKIFAICSRTADGGTASEVVFSFKIPDKSENWSWDMNCIPYIKVTKDGKEVWIRDLSVRQFSTTVNCNQNDEHPLVQQFFTQLELLSSSSANKEYIADPVTGQGLTKAHVQREFKDFFRSLVSSKIDTDYACTGVPSDAKGLATMAAQSSAANPQLPLFETAPITDVDKKFANYEANYGGTQTISIGRNIELSYGDSWEKSYGNSYAWSKGDSCEMTLSGNSFSYHFASHDEVSWAQGTVKEYSFGDTKKSYSYIDTEESYSKVAVKSKEESEVEEKESRERVYGKSDSWEYVHYKNEFARFDYSTSIQVGGPQFEFSANGPKLSIEAAGQVSIELALAVEISIAGKIELTPFDSLELELSKTGLHVKKDEVEALKTRVTALETSTSTLKADSVAAAMDNVNAKLEKSLVRLCNGTAEMKDVGAALKSGFQIHL